MTAARANSTFKEYQNIIREQHKKGVTSPSLILQALLKKYLERDPSATSFYAKEREHKEFCWSYVYDDKKLEAKDSKEHETSDAGVFTLNAFITALNKYEGAENIKDLIFKDLLRAFFSVYDNQKFSPGLNENIVNQLNLSSCPDFFYNIQASSECLVQEFESKAENKYEQQEAAKCMVNRLPYLAAEKRDEMIDYLLKHCQSKNYDYSDYTTNTVVVGCAPYLALDRLEPIVEKVRASIKGDIISSDTSQLIITDSFAPYLPIATTFAQLLNYVDYDPMKENASDPIFKQDPPYYLNDIEKLKLNAVLSLISRFKELAKSEDDDLGSPDEITAEIPWANFIKVMIRKLDEPEIEEKNGVDDQARCFRQLADFRNTTKRFAWEALQAAIKYIPEKYWSGEEKNWRHLVSSLLMLPNRITNISQNLKDSASNALKHCVRHATTARRAEVISVLLEQFIYLDPVNACELLGLCASSTPDDLKKTVAKTLLKEVEYLPFYKQASALQALDAFVSYAPQTEKTTIVKKLSAKMENLNFARLSTLGRYALSIPDEWNKYILFIKNIEEQSMALMVAGQFAKEISKTDRDDFLKQLLVQLKRGNNLRKEIYQALQGFLLYFSESERFEITKLLINDLKAYQYCGAEAVPMLSACKPLLSQDKLEECVNQLIALLKSDKNYEFITPNVLQAIEAWSTGITQKQWSEIFERLAEIFRKDDGNIRIAICRACATCMRYVSMSAARSMVHLLVEQVVTGGSYFLRKVHSDEGKTPSRDAAAALHALFTRADYPERVAIMSQVTSQLNNHVDKDFASITNARKNAVVTLLHEFYQILAVKKLILLPDKVSDIVIEYVGLAKGR